MKRIIAFLLALIVSVSAVDIASFAVTTNLATPVIACGNTTNKSVKIYWNKVQGANKYYIYRKGQYDTEYTLIAKTSKCYYLDKEWKGDEHQFESCETNSYKVRAYNISDGKIKAKGKISKSVEIVYYSFKTPELKIKLSDKSGVPFIYVDSGGKLYRSTDKNKGYSVLEEYGITESYNPIFRCDSTVKGNTTYYYKTFKKYNYDGKEYTIWSKPVKITTSDVENEHIVKFKKLKNGKQLPNGSAITCTAILLNHLGFDVSKMEMVKYFDCIDDFKQKGDTIYGYNPDYYFIGDPTSNKSYGSGTTTACIQYTLRNFIKEKGYNYSYVLGGLNESERYFDSLGEYDFFVYDGVASLFLNYADVNDINKTKCYLDKNNIAIVLARPKNYSKDEYEIHFTEGNDKFVYTLEKDLEYMILCGYSNDYWIFYNPKTGKYEKTKISNTYEGYSFYSSVAVGEF